MCLEIQGSYKRLTSIPNRVIPTYYQSVLHIASARTKLATSNPKYLIIDYLDALGNLARLSG